MRGRSTGLIAVVIAVLASSPMTFAQTTQQSETAKAPAAAPTLSQDLSRVWVQYLGATGFRVCILVVRSRHRLVGCTSVEMMEGGD